MHTKNRQKIRVIHLLYYLSKIHTKPTTDQSWIFKKFSKFWKKRVFANFDHLPKSTQRPKNFEIFFLWKSSNQSTKLARYQSHTIIPRFLRIFWKSTFYRHFSAHSGRTKNPKNLEMGSKIFFSCIKHVNKKKKIFVQKLCKKIFPILLAGKGVFHSWKIQKWF